MFAYAAVFAGSLLVDLIPVLGPPAWMVMAFMQVRYGLSIWWVLLAGVTGSTIGRLLLARYLVPRLSSRMLTQRKTEELVELGALLNRRGVRTWLFIFVYTLIPIPTSPLFTAAGVARIRTATLLPPFFLGKFVSDGAMVLAGRYTYTNFDAIVRGSFSWQAVAGTAVGMLLLAATLFVDWHAALTERRFRLRFDIWK